MAIYRWRCAGVLAALVGIGGVAAAQPADPYLGIASGFDFPFDATKLAELRDRGDLGAMRRHAWMVLAGLTQPAKSGGALFETWFRSDDVFRFPQAQAARKRPLTHRFETPRQLRARGPHAQAAGQSLFSFTLFNRELRSHIVQYQLYDQRQLQRLHDDFAQKNTPPAERKIPDFPVAAVALKLIWWPVAKGARTPLPVWDYDPVQPADPRHANGPLDGATANDLATWRRVVLVDSGAVAPAPDAVADALFRGRRSSAHVVSHERFYRVTLSADEAKAANQKLVGAARGVIGRELAAGDEMVLIAMHCTTRELPEWTWSSYFWHDRPDDGPKAADRPPATTLGGVWRNYLMDVSFDSSLPRENDGSPHIAYNPYLEARFPNGTLSNCLSCHRRSTWPQVDFLPITRGDGSTVDTALFPPDGRDPAFTADKVRLDFLWSIGDLSLPSP
jgi:hypothetical protein